jgi:L-lactate dehydrogenase
VAWSRAHVAGTPLAEYYANVLGRPLDETTKSNLARHVREAAYDVIQKKGATYYAVALALNRTCRAILRGERSVLTVSTRVDGIYGVPDVCLSIPCVVGRGGIERKIPFHLDDEEVKNWQKSAGAMAEFTESLPLD